MKTLCITLGLLLLIACCCDAMPRAEINMGPGPCCFSFYTHRIPVKRVSSITKIDSSCPQQAFIVETTRGTQLCYSGSFQWALDLYNQLHNTEDSG